MTLSQTVVEQYPKIPLDAFSDELLFEFPDLDPGALAHYTRRAAIHIARIGGVLRRSSDIATQDCVTSYLLESGDCMEVVNILSICNICGSLCGAVTRMTQATCNMPCGTRSWFEEPNIIYFSPVRTGNVYRVRYTVAPTIDACEIDRAFQTKHYDLVIAGVKSYLYAMYDKPWASVNRAQEFKQDYERGIRAAAIDALMGNQRGAVRIRYS